jgi:hypothetical protein
MPARRDPDHDCSNCRRTFSTTCNYLRTLKPERKERVDSRTIGKHGSTGPSLTRLLACAGVPEATHTRLRARWAVMMRLRCEGSGPAMEGGRGGVAVDGALTERVGKREKMELHETGGRQSNQGYWRFASLSNCEGSWGNTYFKSTGPPPSSAWVTAIFE